MSSPILRDECARGIATRFFPRAACFVGFSMPGFDCSRRDGATDTADESLIGFLWIHIALERIDFWRRKPQRPFPHVQAVSATDSIQCAARDFSQSVDLPLYLCWDPDGLGPAPVCGFAKPVVSDLSQGSLGKRLHRDVQPGAAGTPKLPALMFRANLPHLKAITSGRGRLCSHFILNLRYAPYDEKGITTDPCTSLQTVRCPPRSLLAVRNQGAAAPYQYLQKLPAHRRVGRAGF